MKNQDVAWIPAARQVGSRNAARLDQLLRQSGAGLYTSFGNAQTFTPNSFANPDRLSVGPATANKLRTPPLWGLHVRARLMHDAATLTLDEAIRRHAGEARDVVARYNGLRRARRTRLIAFLQSL